MDPISMEKIRAMNKYNKSRRQLLLPTLSLYMAAIFVLGLLLTSPAWFPRLCSVLGFFFLTTLPDLVTAFLLSPKCLFVVGNLIVAFLVGESRLAPRRDDDSQPSLANEIHEEHVKKNTAVASKATTASQAPLLVVADHTAFVGAAPVVEEAVEVKEEEGEEEELHESGGLHCKGQEAKEAGAQELLRCRSMTTMIWQVQIAATFDRPKKDL